MPGDLKSVANAYRVFVAVTSLLSHNSQLSAAESSSDFERNILPIFSAHCTECHGPKQQKNALRLDTAGGLRQGGESGAAFVPGKSDESLIIQYLTGENAEQIRMPPKGPPLTADEIAVLRQWINSGA